jgi:CubicO group peptidase (beta-lactamase class C family)
MLVFAGLFIFCCSIMAAEKLVYPGKNWTVLKDPAGLGWSSEKLAEVRAFTETIDTKAVVVVHRGVIVSEWGETATPILLESMRKSILSSLIGIYAATGDIDIAKTIGELGIDDKEPALSSAEKKATVADLLTSRSGIYHRASYEPRSMAGSRPERGSHPPGTHFFYNNWDFNALGTIFEQQSGLTVFDAFNRHLAGPLGLQDVDSKKLRYIKHKSTNHPAYLFQLSARDVARFGLLYARSGKWKKKQIVPAAWIHESTRTHVQDAGRRSGFGYMWWTPNGKNQQVWGIDLEPGAFIAAGSGGQRLAVLPESDIVVVHLVARSAAAATRGEVSEQEFARFLTMVLDAQN